MARIAETAGNVVKPMQNCISWKLFKLNAHKNLSIAVSTHRRALQKHAENNGKRRENEEPGGGPKNLQISGTTPLEASEHNDAYC